jgi:hypothetical protein
MEDPEKLTILRTQDTRRRKKDKKRKNTTQYVFGHHYPQANTTNI